MQNKYRVPAHSILSQIFTKWRLIASTLFCIFTLPIVANAQLATPTYGWNLGNTLEPPSGEGTWGPAATQNLINSVADSGFNTIRLPVAWDSHANQSTYQIDGAWMARVKQVVDWCYAKNLYVIVNSHWDGGWLEQNITATVDPVINAKMQSYWTQIATAFAGYDNHLLFAGANEPACNTAEEWATLRTYYNTFISAVRATGGNNTDRWLVVQGPNTNWEASDMLITSMPDDSTPGRLALEIHHYTPYPFSLMSQDASWGNMSYFWGQAYHHPTRTDRNATFDEEDGVDAMFQLMADRFISQGYPVIIGEFMAIKRDGYPDLTGADYDLHVASRTYFHKYIVDSANSHGLKPIYWDIAGQMFDWNTGAVTDPDNLLALTGGPALPPPGSGCTANTISVESIAVSIINAGGGKKKGETTVIVVNDCGSPVSGALVTGDFSGSISEYGVSAITDASGVATLQTSGNAKGRVSITFCVNDVSAAGLTYNSTANVEFCDNN